VLTELLLPNFHAANVVRGFIFGKFMKNCGRRFALAAGFRINMIARMSVGNDVYLAHDIWINATGGLQIGNATILGPRVIVATSSHDRRENRVLLREGVAEKVDIGHGVWISSGSVVTKGVNIGDGAVVGALSVVMHDVPANTLVGGQPARVIRTL
jgi:acetyltransferase-like isoleucine patch superfamily enzyme